MIRTKASLIVDNDYYDNEQLLNQYYLEFLKPNRNTSTNEFTLQVSDYYMNIISKRDSAYHEKTPEFIMDILKEHDLWINRDYAILSNVQHCFMPSGDSCNEEKFDLAFICIIKIRFY